MKTAKLTLISTVAAALGLAVALGAAPAAAFHCKGAHDFPDCEPGGGGGGDGDKSGKGLKLVVTIDTLEDNILTPDGNAVYVDKEGGVTAATGGETQPNPPGFGVSLTGKGKNPREVLVSDLKWFQRCKTCPRFQDTPCWQQSVSAPAEAL